VFFAVGQALGLQPFSACQRLRAGVGGPKRRWPRSMIAIGRPGASITLEAKGSVWTSLSCRKAKEARLSRMELVDHAAWFARPTLASTVTPKGHPWGRQNLAQGTLVQILDSGEGEAAQGPLTTWEG